METECSMDALRALAPQWSLAGDDKLLNILQNTHTNILTKCQEVNQKLELMSAELDNASIDLQNVNNKFLALSNSQFIESRVYDDDADVSTDMSPVKETPQKPQPQELDLEALKKSLMVLQNHHEKVTILKDSDTETDSDGEDGDRVVLKPKDLYSDRPLPYIIGSQAWKNCWHAGLLPEESDSESGSEGREPQSPQYSDSDSEPEDIQVDSKANATISEASSDLASEQDTPLPIPKPTPADIAADLARRLGGRVPQMVELDSEYPPKTISKTVYKPQQPQTGTIFTDEPPPLDSQTESSEEDDIFAELHKPKERVVEDLFAGRVFDAGKAAPQPRTEQKPLFEDDADEFDDEPVKRVEEDKNTAKKPVGGISVFGTNKGAESIGAAILKRNQRKSISEEETDSEDQKPPPKSKTVDQIDSIKKEKDIFDDLFAKSATLEKKKQTEKDKIVKDKVDLFSDNLFDDVGDIFTTNVMKNQSNQKSIFDDDDDLFADIATPVTSTVPKSTEIQSNNKSIFDSDDELFADKPTVIAKSSQETNVTEANRVEKSDLVSSKLNIQKPKTVTNTEKPTKDKVDDSKSIDYMSNAKSTAITKSIFDSDSDSDIFSNLVKNKDTESKPETKGPFEVKDKVVTEDIFKNKLEVSKNVLNIGGAIKNLRSPSLFDDDDDDELFADISKDTSKDTNITPTDTSILRESPITTAEIPINEKPESSKTIPELPGIDTVHKVSVIASEPECEKTAVSVNNDSNVFDIKESNISNKPQKNYAQENSLKNNSVDSYTLGNSPSVYDNENENENTFESKESEQKDLVGAIKKSSIQRNQNLIHKDIESELEKDKPIPVIDDEDHLNKQEPIMDDDFIDKDALFQKQKVLISKDVFVDEPPIFEKPKEPKRSKNVNALFDDDSEDEALFFRKSDMDDKSENFPSTVQADQIFGIFHDEPPSIDDFGKDENIGIFNSVISERNRTKDKIPDIFQQDNKIDDLKHMPPEQSKNISEHKDGDASISKTENMSIEIDRNHQKIDRSITKNNNDSDYLFNTEKYVPETNKSTNKEINFHDTYREIKEEEFDDIFKAANKVNNNKNDDSFNFIVDELAENTAKNRNQSEKLPENKETDFGKAETIKSEVEYDSDEELFRILPKPEKPKVPEYKPSDEIDKGALIKEDKIFISEKLEDKPMLKTVDKFEVKEDSRNFTSKNDITEDLNQKPELRKKDTNHSNNNDVKKNSRIKSLNLNIDVSTLLPGASPKKQKVETPKEDHMSDTPSEEIKRITQENDSKLVKSISFERKPNSEVLDNTVSKERARIQVKRRPSTRRARREAVRKSVIDIDDSTDNSSSIDDPPKSVKTENTPEINIKTVSNESSSNILIQKDSAIDNNEIDTTIAPEIPKNIAVIDNTAPEKPKVTSKVVYILNDEDIFNTKPIVKESEIFKKDPIIPTLGSMYGETTKSDNPGSEIAKKSTKVSIFDSDSDEELFGGKSKTKKKVELKGSLFGDDEDDNLFGVKSKKTDASPKPQTSKTVSRDIEKSSEPTFSDPLSMLDDEYI